MLDTIRRDKLYKVYTPSHTHTHTHTFTHSLTHTHTSLAVVMQKLPDYVLSSSKLPEMLEQYHSLDELTKSIEDVPDYVSIN